MDNIIKLPQTFTLIRPHGVNWGLNKCLFLGTVYHLISRKGWDFFTPEKLKEVADNTKHPYKKVDSTLAEAKAIGLFDWQVERNGRFRRRNWSLGDLGQLIEDQDKNPRNGFSLPVWHLRFKAQEAPTDWVAPLSAQCSIFAKAEDKGHTINLKQSLIAVTGLSRNTLARYMEDLDSYTLTRQECAKASTDKAVINNLERPAPIKIQLNNLVNNSLAKRQKRYIENVKNGILGCQKRDLHIDKGVLYNQVVNNQVQVMGEGCESYKLDNPFNLSAKAGRCDDNPAQSRDTSAGYKLAS